MADGPGSNTGNVNNKPRVFRLRNLPAHVDRLSAVELLCGSIDGISAQDVRISSLAYDVDVWSWMRTKVATLTLNKGHSVLNSMLNGGECTIPVPGLPKPLIMDHHFQGITPLNHVPDVEHKYDCLIISGLASHPFGSWQAHGHDKSFMWIRDELPQRLAGVRFLIYGYDTALSGSTSFQIIPDLAISLVQTMKAVGWSAPSAKPILFLTHSLGGVVLKQALVILAGCDSQERAILEKVKGAVSFGAPSQGMSIPDIFEMLGDQPNVALVKDLSNQSEFLPRLDEQFGNISYLQRLQFFWAFETKVTPIVEKADATGRFARTGPGTVMVSRESATRNLCHLQPSSTIQVDQNHSDMVKFGVGDHYIGIIASKLESICAMSQTATPDMVPQSVQKSSQEEGPTPTAPSDPHTDLEEPHHELQRPQLQPEWTLPDFWNDDKILSSLHAPERDRRLEQINQKLGNTFNWVYDDPSVGLSQWLQKGAGIFWINGKPASGKSTLMKYLYQDARTDELLRAGRWRSRPRLMTASFFFHHRGNNMQKSFEGLLRSLLSQVLEQEKCLLTLLHPILVEQYQADLASSKLGNLEEDIWALLDRFRIPTSSRVISEVEKTVSSQRELTKNRQLGIHLKRMLKDLGVKLYLEPAGTYDEVEFDDPEIILSTMVKPSQKLEQGVMSQWPEPTNWREVLIVTLKNHYERERIKMDIEAKEWSRSDLEDGLRRVTGQSLFKMELFLFLDALDEYDGRSEFIASFLQDLVQQAADPGNQSSTHIRILFSSRPWKALHDEFAACPGFQIHDYTWNDILDFCAASIPPDNTAKTILSPLVTDIVRRARGVFLWVELVMRDLAETVLQRLQLRNTEGLEHELRKTLNGMPDELDDYYQVLVQRIPPGARWECYVVLETICRSEEDMETETLLAILKCSSTKSLADAQNRLKKHSAQDLDKPGRGWGERYIKVASGGLVEFGGLSSQGRPIVQFMHQTVKQFVIGPWFKFQLLGNNLGMFVTENGHSFISKYSFATSDFEARFFQHARQAEMTTGFSQYDFFSRAPSTHQIFSFGISSMIEWAVMAGLQLCVNDAYEADRDCIRKKSAGLLSLLFATSTKNGRPVSAEKSIDETINMAGMLVANGLSIDENNDGFVEVVRRMWKEKDHGTSRCLVPEYEQLAVVLVGAISRSSVFTRPVETLRMSPGSTASLNSDAATPQLLHRVTPRLIRPLLARGFNSNTLQDGTPIDTVLDGENLYSPDPRENLLHQYDIVSQLVRHKGLLFTTERSRWNAWETLCASHGLDVSVFREAGFPLWYSSTQKARKHRSLRQFLSSHIRR